MDFKHGAIVKLVLCNIAVMGLVKAFSNGFDVALYF